MPTRITHIFGWVIGGIAVGVLFAFLFGWLVMLLWNWIMPAVFGLSAITYWQAWGLVILTHILFKCGPGHGDHHPPFHKHPREWKDRFKCKLDEHFKECKEKHEEKDEGPTDA